MNRPKEWNRLSSLIIEVSSAIKKFEENKEIAYKLQSSFLYIFIAFII